MYPTPLPAVLRHEGAGIVEEVGASVTNVKPGDHVVMSAAYCGHCPQCRSGNPAYYENRKRLRDGAESVGDKSLVAVVALASGRPRKPSSTGTAVVPDRAVRPDTRHRGLMRRGQRGVEAVAASVATNTKRWISRG